MYASKKLALTLLAGIASISHSAHAALFDSETAKTAVKLTTVAVCTAGALKLSQNYWGVSSQDEANWNEKANQFNEDLQVAWGYKDKEGAEAYLAPWGKLDISAQYDCVIVDLNKYTGEKKYDLLNIKAETIAYGQAVAQAFTKLFTKRTFVPLTPAQKIQHFCTAERNIQTSLENNKLSKILTQESPHNRYSQKRLLHNQLFTNRIDADAQYDKWQNDWNFGKGTLETWLNECSYQQSLVGFLELNKTRASLLMGERHCIMHLLNMRKRTDRAIGIAGLIAGALVARGAL